jgi:predicted glycosyltransferase
LKLESGEKIAPYVFKISDTKAIKEYLDKERITYEIYQEEKIIKQALENSNQESRKKRKVSEE